MSDAPELRVSDADRERVVQRLQHAAGEGRLTMEELAERVDAAYEARVGSELAVLTRDLPEPAPGAVLGEPSAAKPPARWIFAFMGGGKRKGRWRVGERLRAVAFWGGGDLDLREASLEGGSVTITLVAVMGGFDITVPPGVDVEVSGFAFMGGRDVNLSGDQPPPGAPRIHIRAFAVMGGIDINEKPVKRTSLPPHPSS